MDEVTKQYTTRYTTDPQYSQLFTNTEEVQKLARTLAAQARFQEVMKSFDYNDNLRVSTLKYSFGGIIFLIQFNSLDKSQRHPPTAEYF